MRNKEEILKLAYKIKPVMRMKDNEIFMIDNGKITQKGKLVYLCQQDIRSIAYLREPKYACDAPKLRKVGEDITTYHTYGYPLLFKPSIKEVLEQIPEGYLKNDIVAFELYIESNQAIEIITRHNGQSVHKAKVRLYKLAEGEKVPVAIQKQPVHFDGHRYSPPEESEKEI